MISLESLGCSTEQDAPSPQELYVVRPSLFTTDHNDPQRVSAVRAMRTVTGPHLALCFFMRNLVKSRYKVSRSLFSLALEELSLIISCAYSVDQQ